MWKLKEFERSMYKIIEVIDEDGNVVKTFVADQLTYAEKKKKAQLIAAAPDLLQAAGEAQDYLKEFPEESLGKKLGYELECIIKKV
ncbi:hypothetical protein DFR79_13244 [Halanaerobium saccharolyticum]|uniref:Uncharacterized protein n=1 Tax=Halanaerobium saccharolyticum TaxID=43595 RepID=A0A4R6LHU9_9FIRM|nr:hypothetical protein [Halanaerobium saccharolyticum]TDO77712.1 hypothetical protein DFR79_13244 [Halanaerobium saccharolyticum]